MSLSVIKDYVLLNKTYDSLQSSSASKVVGHTCGHARGWAHTVICAGSPAPTSSEHWRMSCRWVFMLSWVHVWGVWASSLSWGKLWWLRPTGAGCRLPIKPQCSIEILLTNCIYDLDTWSLKLPVNKLRCVQCALWGSNETMWEKCLEQVRHTFKCGSPYSASVWNILKDSRIQYLHSPSKWQMWLLLTLWSCLENPEE